jgi:hypothetical protein
MEKIYRSNELAINFLKSLQQYSFFKAIVCPSNNLIITYKDIYK